MESKKIRRLPVIDDNKRMVGILSFGDISHAAPPKQAGELMAASRRTTSDLPGRSTLSLQR